MSSGAPIEATGLEGVPGKGSHRRSSLGEAAPAMVPVGWSGCSSLLAVCSGIGWRLQGDSRVGRAAASGGGERLTLFLTLMVQPRAPGLMIPLEEAERQGDRTWKQQGAPGALSLGSS